MDAQGMTRREALEAQRPDDARQIQPRRFSIVLRCATVRVPSLARRDVSAHSAISARSPLRPPLPSLPPLTSPVPSSGNL